MRVHAVFFLLLTTASAWDFAHFSREIQRLLHLQIARIAKTLPTRFDTQPNCMAFLHEARRSTYIAYNYGLNETSPGCGRELVNCLSIPGTNDVRAAVQNVYIAAPVIGSPAPRQQSFVELLDMLPNLEIIKLPARGDLHFVEHWLTEEYPSNPIRRRRSTTQQKDQRPSIDFVPDHLYRFDECVLDTIQADSGFGEGINRIYRAMTACDNICNLDVSISQGGCVIESTIDSFDWKAGDKFSTLESLRLSGYGWESGRPWPNERPRPPSVSAWKAAMDWSKLKRLDLDRPPRAFLDAFNGQLSGLESFKLRPKWGFWGDEETFCAFDQNATDLRAEYESFINALPPLKELSVGGLGELLNITSILQTHGPSLENLTIHEFERDCHPCGNTTWTRPTLSISDLEVMLKRASNLKHLELDIYRRWDWPWPVLMKLSEFQNLTSITIWLDLQDPHEQRMSKRCNFNFPEHCVYNVAMEPRLTKQAAAKMFKILRAGQNVQKLETAEFRTGNIGRRQGGGMRIGPILDKDYHATAIICKSLLNGEECWEPIVDDDFDDDSWY